MRAIGRVRGAPAGAGAQRTRGPTPALFARDSQKQVDARTCASITERWPIACSAMHRNAHAVLLIAAAPCAGGERDRVVAMALAFCSSLCSAAAATFFLAMLVILVAMLACLASIRHAGERS